MKTVLVFAGGNSNEREVSLRSGIAVSEALRNKGYKVILRDPEEGIMVEEDVDVVFPALHGAGGEDGSIQTELEKHGKPYVGADTASSELCFDKSKYKKLLRAAGYHVGADEVVSRESIWSSPLLTKPFVLKPVSGGSSIDVYIVRDPTSVTKETIDRVFIQYEHMLLEELIEGVELTVGVLGETALPVIEIIPPANEEFDYNNKYNGKTQELCPPVHIDKGTQKRAQELAVAIHSLTGARDLSRTDMILRSDGEIVILETNTLPGMTPQSLYPKAAAEAAIPMEELTDQLVQMALARAS